MNRRVVYVGLAILLGTLCLVAFPFVANGTEDFDLEQLAGVLVLPIGLLVILFGASSPDPTKSTIVGVFGNPDENRLRKDLDRPTERMQARFLSSPKESVRCRHCYTRIPTVVPDCPRCGRRRECRGCGKPLFFLAGAARCGPCVRDEIYCNCPKGRKTGGPPGATYRVGS